MIVFVEKKHAFLKISSKLLKVSISVYLFFFLLLRMMNHVRDE